LRTQAALEACRGRPAADACLSYALSTDAPVF
jgi:hypothetical protein